MSVIEPDDRISYAEAVGALGPILTVHSTGPTLEQLVRQLAPLAVKIIFG